MPALRSEPDPTREEPVPQIEFKFGVRSSGFGVRRSPFAVRRLKFGVPERSPLRAAYQEKEHVGNSTVFLTRVSDP